MEPFFAMIEGRFAAIEFVLEQLISRQCLTAPNPVQNALEARDRMKVLLSRTTAGPGMNPEDFEQISAEMSKYMNYLMNRVVKRVQDVADDE